MKISDATQAFCDFYGFNPDYLAGPDRYTVTGVDSAFSKGTSNSFTGRVRALRVRRNGRFGNIVLQLLHATLLARHLRIDEIQAFPFPGGPTDATVERQGLRYSFAADHSADTPALEGEFFNSYAFQSALSALQADFITTTLDEFVRTLFAQRLDAAPSGDDTAVLHFRSGDIFNEPPDSNWYVQPPAAFYLCALANLRDAYGVKRAMLVFEDRRNPAVDAVETALRHAGVPVLLTDGTFDADLNVLLGATHIIASFSTFPEAAALLSHRLRSFSAFRSVESHAHLHAHRPRPLLNEVLRARGASAWVASVEPGHFIAPLQWHNTPAQRRLIVDFPIADLHLAEVRAPALSGDRNLLANTMDEALRLRSALVDARLAAASPTTAEIAAPPAEAGPAETALADQSPSPALLHPAGKIAPAGDATAAKLEKTWAKRWFAAQVVSLAAIWSNG
jgi:hypothetical protein